MKEDLKTILYMGLGALSETNEKLSDIKDDLYTKGKELYEKGVIANEELKHNIGEVIKDRVNVFNVNTGNDVEKIIKIYEKMPDDEKRELLRALNKKGWNDAENDKGKGQENS